MWPLVKQSPLLLVLPMLMLVLPVLMPMLALLWASVQHQIPTSESLAGLRLSLGRCVVTTVARVPWTLHTRH